MQTLLDRGIATRRGIMCAHREKPYRDLHQDGSLVFSELAQDHCVLLPIFYELTEEQQELRRLREENRRLKLEREVLKKAAAFFAKESS